MKPCFEVLREKTCFKILKELIDLAKDSSYVKVTTLAKRANVSRSAIYYHIKKLKELGLVEVKDTAQGMLVRPCVNSIQDAVEQIMQIVKKELFSLLE